MNCIDELEREIASLPPGSVFVKKVKGKDSLSAINSDLKYLEAGGHKYVLIDEVTLMEDFINLGVLFPS